MRAMRALAVAAWIAAGACGSTDSDRAALQQLDRPSGPTLPADATAAGDDVPTADTLAPLAPDGTACDRDAACASGWCLPTRDGSRCAASCATQPCPEGLECTLVTEPDGLVGRLCVDRFAPLCLPCAVHGDCNLVADGLAANRCVDAGDAGRFCGVSCGPGRPPCPEGYACGQDSQCRPDAGACTTCPALGVELGATTACRAPESGCAGLRACTSDGLGPCDAPAAHEEVCNGADDDCNGETDEDPRALCGDFACHGAAGCRVTCADDTDCASGFRCDTATGRCASDGADGTACTRDQDCASDHCANGYCCSVADALCCAADRDCSVLDEPPVCTSRTTSGCVGFQAVGRCVDAVCDQEVVSTPVGCAETLCHTGHCAALTFEVPSRCAADGRCEPAGPDIVCDDANPCSDDSCSSQLGCQATPRSGASSAGCYSHDPATRGVGACRDGVLYCAQGVASSCVGDQGPSPERCDGADNDCDGAIDEDTVALCAPHTCGGAAGCRTGCASTADCAPGAFCDASGRCQSAGLPGSPCTSPSQCKGGHCDHGVCCTSGTCCQSTADCAAFDATLCSAASPLGCVGTRTTGVCDATTHQCGSTTTLDPAGCAGLACTAPNCVGTLRFPGAHCNALGLCLADAAPTDCAPFVCQSGLCTGGCTTDADCATGSICGANGQCSANVANGGACTAHAQCISGHCANGFCCAGGTCCASNANCAALTQPAVCDAPASCSGHQVVGVCNAAKQCVAQTVAAPSGCAGVTCGDPVCINLSGLEVVLEGVRRRQCNAGGVCADVQRDCRDLGAAAYCTKNSNFYAWCANCSPERATCIDLDGSCACE